jgi:hypothetical protein
VTLANFNARVGSSHYAQIFMPIERGKEIALSPNEPTHVNPPPKNTSAFACRGLLVSLYRACSRIPSASQLQLRFKRL